MVEIEAMKSNLKRNKIMTYDQKGNFFGMPRGEFTGKAFINIYTDWLVNIGAGRLTPSIKPLITINMS